MFDCFMSRKRQTKSFWQVFWLTLSSIALPIHTEQWMCEYHQSCCRVYSSGSVWEFHPIPFSPFPSERRKQHQNAVANVITFIRWILFLLVYLFCYNKGNENGNIEEKKGTNLLFSDLSQSVIRLRFELKTHSLEGLFINISLSFRSFPNYTI